jgi:hypothetical protein
MMGGFGQRGRIFRAPRGRFLAILQIQFSSSILERDPGQIGAFSVGAKSQGLHTSFRDNPHTRLG